MVLPVLIWAFRPVAGEEHRCWNHTVTNVLDVLPSETSWTTCGTADRLAQRKANQVPGRIQVNIDRLRRLIVELLDLSRIEAGRIELRREPIAIPELVSDVAEGLRSLTSVKAITLEARHLSVLQPIEADRDHLTQILTNLVGNAIKFTPSGDRIQVTTEIQDHCVLTFSLADRLWYCPGRTAQSVRQILSWSAIACETPGTGSGLAFAKSFVELHG